MDVVSSNVELASKQTDAQLCRVLLHTFLRLVSRVESMMGLMGNRPSAKVGDIESNNAMGAVVAMTPR